MYTWQDREVMQLLDFTLLKSDLFHSILYLHSQPPFFNIFIGIILKLFPGSYEIVFTLLYALVGLATSLSIFLILVKLGLPERLSVFSVCLFIINPATILFENILFYTYFVVAFLVFSTLFLYRFVEHGRFKDGFIFFLLLSLIVLIRSFFHVVWFLAFVLILFFCVKKSRRVILLSAVVPFLLLTLWTGKNLYYFGSFSNSTWFGLSFSKMTVSRLPQEEKISLIKQGKISELSLLPPGRGVWWYRDYIDFPKQTKTNIPLLDDQTIGSSNNYNNLLCISLSKQYAKDSFYVLLHYPQVYLKSIAQSLACFFCPSCEWFSIVPEVDINRQKIGIYAGIYDAIVGGRPGISAKQNTETTDKDSSAIIHFANMAFLEIVKFVVSVIFGCYLLFSLLKHKKSNRPEALTLFFIVCNVIYITLLTNMMEIGENQRFRYNIEAFVLILTTLFVCNVIKRLLPHNDLTH